MIARAYPPLRDKPVNSTYLPVRAAGTRRARPRSARRNADPCHRIDECGEAGFMTRRRCHSRVRHGGGRRRSAAATPGWTGHLTVTCQARCRELRRRAGSNRRTGSLAFRTARRPQISAFSFRSESAKVPWNARQTVELLLTRSKVPTERFWRNDTQSCTFTY